MSGSWPNEHTPILPSGAVLGWISDDHTVLPYPEIAALYIRWMLRSGRARDRLTSTLHFLADAVDRDGRIRRGPHPYLFDTALALLALTEAERCGLRGPWCDRIPLLKKGALSLLEGLDDLGLYPSDRWSRAPAGHLLKALAWLRLAWPEAPWADPIERLADQQRNDGSFPDREGSDATYCHAHCYAVEGLVMLEGADSRRAALGLDWLCDRIDSDGDLEPWWPPRGEPGALDAAAQTLRLLLLCRPEHPAIQPLRTRLDALRESGGVLPWRVGSGHLNTWVTIFYLQALDWLNRSRAEPGWIPSVEELL